MKKSAFFLLLFFFSRCFSVTIGIDLGTTNSVVAVMEKEAVKIIPTPNGNHLVPSIVYFPPTGSPIIGSRAKPYLTEDPTNTIYSIKRFLGRPFAAIQHKASQVPYHLIPGSDGYAVVEVRGKQYSPVEISSMILKYLKEVSEKHLGKKVDSAVITVPANFNDIQRQMTRDAAQKVGIEVKRIINEPTAAALAYGFDAKRNGKIAVFDFGGGTFDISILDIEDRLIEVKATSGNLWLGGDDLDTCISNYILDYAKRELANPPLKISKEALRLQAKRAKEALSRNKGELIDLASLFDLSTYEGHSEKIKLALTKEIVKDYCKSIFAQLLNPLRQALKDAKLSPEKVDEIILVGGSTRNVIVQDLVRNFFKKEPNISLNPDEVVAIGAAIQAGILTGEAPHNMLLFDVTPLSIGIESLGGLMHKFIERNTPIPTKKSKIFSTAQDNQRVVTIKVLQGERQFAKDNILLGEFDLIDIPPMPRGKPQIKVTFSIDANGIVTVSAQEHSLGNKRDIIITNRTTLTPQSIDSLIESAKQFEKIDTKARQVLEKKNLLKELIYQAGIALKENKKLWFWQKKSIQKSIDAQKKALRADDLVTLDNAIEEVSSILLKI